MQDWRQSVIEAVDRLENEAVELCRALVRVNSVNPYAGGPEGGEAKAQRVLEGELKRLGFDTRLFEPPSGVYRKAGVLGPKDRSHVGRPNLVGELRFGEGGKAVVLNGHIDTVGIADMVIEPFKAEARDGKIWGRGSADCKGSLTGGVMAVRALKEAGVLDSGRILFESVVDEECSGSGAGTIACCLEGYKGDHCIVLDGAVDYLTVECMGLLTGYVTVTGEGGHAAHRNRVSALDMACLVKEELDGLKRERLAMHDMTSFCIGDFKAGDAPWMVPRIAKMGFNMSFPLEEAERGRAERKSFSGILARESVERVLESSRKRHPWLEAHPPTVEWIKDLAPFRTERNAPVVLELLKAHEQVAGRPAPMAIEPGWGDAAWLNALGGMPVATFGAGHGGAAHSADESVEIRNLLLQAKVVALATAALLKA